MLASTSTELNIFDCDRWNVITSYGKHKEPVKSLTWSDDGKYLLQVSAGHGVNILKLTDEDIQCVQDIASKDSLTCATFYREGVRHVAAGAASGKTHVWDTKTRSFVKTLSPSSNKTAVKLVDLNIKNTNLAAAMNNGEIILYSIMSNHQSTAFRIPDSESISSLKFHNEFRSVLAIASDEGSILLRDLNKGKDKMFLKTAHSAPITGIAFSPINKDVMVSASYDKNAHVHDIRLQTVVNTIQTDNFLSSVDMNTNSLVAVGTKSGEIMVYDLRNYKMPIIILKEHSTTVTNLKFQPYIPKNKKASAFNISLKEINRSPLKSPKSPTKSIESQNLSSLINDTVSPLGKYASLSNSTPRETNSSHDSFLSNIINQSSMYGESKIQSFNEYQKVKSLSLSHKLKTSHTKDLIESVLTSTPVDSGNNQVRKQDESTTYSPIVNEDVNGNSKRSIDIPDCNSAAETIKCNIPNAISADQMKELFADQVKELKDYIKYQTHEVLFETGNNFWNITVQNIKHRLFLEDHLMILHQKMQMLQQGLHTVMEENKRLHIEVEMLKAAKKQSFDY